MIKWQPFDYFFTNKSFIPSKPHKAARNRLWPISLPCLDRLSRGQHLGCCVESSLALIEMKGVGPCCNILLALVALAEAAHFEVLIVGHHLHLLRTDFARYLCLPTLKEVVVFNLCLCPLSTLLAYSMSLLQMQLQSIPFPKARKAQLAATSQGMSLQGRLEDRLALFCFPPSLPSHIDFLHLFVRLADGLDGVGDGFPEIYEVSLGYHEIFVHFDEGSVLSQHFWFSNSIL